MTVACLEAKFFEKFWSLFSEHVVLDQGSPLSALSAGEIQTNRDLWPALRAFMTGGFLTKSRDEWAGIFHGTDACTVPVLSPKEATDLEDPSPMPHPNLSRNTTLPPSTIGTLRPGQQTREIMLELGIAEDERQYLIRDEIVLLPEGSGRHKL